jgi:hypothetical protein
MARAFLEVPAFEAVAPFLKSLPLHGDDQPLEREVGQPPSRRKHVCMPNPVGATNLSLPLPLMNRPGTGYGEPARLGKWARRLFRALKCG